MPTKKSAKNGTRKSSALVVEPEAPKPVEREIVVQDPPESSKQPDTGQQVGSAEETLFQRIDSDPVQKLTPLEELEESLFSAIYRLKKVYADACNTKAEKIMIERGMFEGIATLLQDAWEHSKTALRTLEECTVLGALKRIQTSIDGLEQKHEDIQTKITEAPENSEPTDRAVLQALRHLQDGINRLEQKHDALEAKVFDNSSKANTAYGTTSSNKTYADVAKPSNNNGTRNKQQQRQQSQQRAQQEALRKQASTSAITLSTKQATREFHETLTNMPNKAIAERLQTALDNTMEQAPKILGISKLNNAIRVQFGTEDAANTTRSTKLDWSTALGTKAGVNIHEASYGVVVYRVPTSVVDPDAGPDAIKEIEKQNNIAPGTITKLTNLQWKNKPPTEHRPIALHFNNVIAANKCITNGVYCTLSTHDTSRNATVHSTKSLNVSIVINMDIKQSIAKPKHNVESVEIGTPRRIAKRQNHNVSIVVGIMKHGTESAPEGLPRGSV